MTYEIINKRTGNAIAKNLSSVKATELMNKLDKDKFQLKETGLVQSLITKKEKIYFDITEDERRAVGALQTPTFLPASFDKRFCRHIKSANHITDGQRNYIWKLVYKYRRQIKDEKLIELAKKHLSL